MFPPSTCQPLSVNEEQTTNVKVKVQLKKAEKMPDLKLFNRKQTNAVSDSKDNKAAQ